MKIKENLIHGLFMFNALLVVLVLIGIFALLVNTSIPAFREIDIKEFLFKAAWNPTSYVKETYGIGSMLVSSVMVTAGALLFAVPIGIGTAAYLSDVASPGVREMVKPIIEILAGIPSVVIGFLGIVFVGPIISRTFGLPNGLNAVNGSILLGVMALPTIISLSEDALSSVSKTYTTTANICTEIPC